MASNRRANGQFEKGSNWREPQPHWEYDWLFIEYETKQRSTGDISEQVGCTEANILYWLRKHGIPRRTISEARQVKRWGAAGENNPMFGRLGEASPTWKGGITPERQKQYSRSAWKKIKREVLERDKHTCQRCGCRPEGKRAIHAHHIKSWDEYPALRLDANNIVTLCRACHRWVHSKANTGNEFLG